MKHIIEVIISAWKMADDVETVILAQQCAMILGIIFLLIKK